MGLSGEEDGPGSYAIAYDKLEVNRARSGGDVVGKLAAGAYVVVVEAKTMRNPHYAPGIHEIHEKS